MQEEKNITNDSAARLTSLGRWFFIRRRLALVLILSLAISTLALLIFHCDHKLIFIPLELGTKFLIVYPAIWAGCRWYGSSITRFRTEKKAVWLTFDDGPHPEDTPELLKLLKQHNAKATFFVIGRHVEKHPELARAILRDGHSLGNHTQNHPVAFFWSFLAPQLTREIDRCTRTIAEATGQTTRWFRAPAGMANLFLHFLLCDRKMNLIGWSARGFDGLFHNPDAMAKRIFKAIQPGAIVLMHEGRRDRQGRRINLILAEKILTRLTAEGYVCLVPEEKDFA